MLIIAKGKLVAFDEPENLEKLLMASHMVSFVAESQAQETEEILQEIESVSQWEVYDICRDIFLAFAGKKKALLELTSKRANLEDVFIELTEGDVK